MTCSNEERALPLEGGKERLEELVDVLVVCAVDAFAVVGTRAGGVLADGAELGQATQVGLEERDAEVEALGEFAAAGRAVEDQGPQDRDPDPVAEDVDGSFDVFRQVGSRGGRHGVIVVAPVPIEHL